jgi:hypothetical protein
VIWPSSPGQGISARAHTPRLFANIGGEPNLPAARAQLSRAAILIGVPLAICDSGGQVLGLGKIGQAVAGFGKVFGMKVIAWSQKMTERAQE